MSLIDSFSESFIFMTETRTPDGEGGANLSWTEGEEFQGALVLDNSIAARVAESEGTSDIYTLTTKRDVAPDFHSVFKRKSDGTMFRITSNGADKKSPNVGTLDMRQASAEKWNITS